MAAAPNDVIYMFGGITLAELVPKIHPLINIFCHNLSNIQSYHTIIHFYIIVTPI